MLYRLLENYPTEKLTVIETAAASRRECRLRDVEYLSIPFGQSSWMNTRFHPFMSAFFSATANRLVGRILNAVNNKAFDCVLTVAHGFGWLAAARFAEARGVTLHLIIHDDWPRIADVPSGFRPWLDRRFGEIYEQAESRLCVSPSMRDFYTRRYGKPAEVLYPGRAFLCPEFGVPPARLSQNRQSLTVAFAGTINSDGYVKALKTLHSALEPVGGTLLIFGPLTEQEAKNVGLDQPGIVLCGLLKWNDLIERLREDADVLFVPMSFEAVDSSNMEMAFPSKLADYTAVGLPLLIYGPGYCSAVRWANENPGTAEVVSVEGTGPLKTAVERLASGSADRVLLGRRALSVGRRYFSYGVMQETFNRALMRSIV
jgi:Glycosyltransferase Family 4